MERFGGPGSRLSEMTGMRAATLNAILHSFDILYCIFETSCL